MESYRAPDGAEVEAGGLPDNDLVAPLQLRTDFGDLSLLYAVTVSARPAT